MTSEQIKQVREAAVLLHDWEHPNPIKYKARHPWEDHINDFDLDDAKDIASLEVCEFAISLVGTDGELPVTKEWILDYWGGKHLPRTHVNNLESYQVGILTLQDFEDGKRFSVCVGDEHLSIITNRYQFRLLAAALGIKRKGE